MSIDWALYCDGRRQECDTDVPDLVGLTKGAGGTFAWLDLVDPSLAELEEVAEQFDLHPLAVEDAFVAHQRPKLERYDDSLFVILKTLRYVEETADVKPAEIELFVGPRYCITVRHGKADPVSDARRRLDSDLAEVLACGPTAVLYAVCDTVVNHYMAIAKQIEDDIEDVEALVFDDRAVDERRGVRDPRRRKTDPNHAEVIYKLKREVLEFRRMTRPLIEPLARLAAGHEPLVHPDAHEYFRDVHDHLVRVVDAVEVYNAQLSDILNANLTQVSVRQNDDMRKISAYAAMITVPTFIAGLYGMNFEHMPELHSVVGYPAALSVMALVCFVLFRTFKRSGWL
jgi:magnesium transporter